MYGGAAFVFGTDLEEKQRLFDALASFNQRDDVRAIVFFNDADALTEAEHRRYFDTLELLHDDNKDQQATMLLERENHAIDQFLSRVIALDKLVVFCLSGEIATPFFGLSLAGDIRLVNDDTRFCLSHVAQGVPPIGGLAYWLPRFVGQGRAAEWLLLGGTIESTVAMKHGLVTDLLPEATFEAECIKWISNAVERVDGTPSTRRLLYYDVMAFGRFIHDEAKLREQVLHNASKERFS